MRGDPGEGNDRWASAEGRAREGRERPARTGRGNNHHSEERRGREGGGGCLLTFVWKYSYCNAMQRNVLRPTFVWKYSA